MQKPDLRVQNEKQTGEPARRTCGDSKSHSKCVCWIPDIFSSATDWGVGVKVNSLKINRGTTVSKVKVMSVACGVGCGV